MPLIYGGENPKNVTGWPSAVSNWQVVNQDQEALALELNTRQLLLAICLIAGKPRSRVSSGCAVGQSDLVEVIGLLSFACLPRYWLV